MNDAALGLAAGLLWSYWFWSAGLSISLLNNQLQADCLWSPITPASKTCVNGLGLHFETLFCQNLSLSHMQLRKEQGDTLWDSFANAEITNHAQIFQVDRYCWWKKSCDVKTLYIWRIYVPSGAGFLPSVCWFLCLHLAKLDGFLWALLSKTITWLGYGVGASRLREMEILNWWPNLYFTHMLSQISVYWPRPWIPRLYLRMTAGLRSKLSSAGVTIKKRDPKTGKTKVPET